MRWKRYIARLCAEAWDLDAIAAEKLVERFEALVAVGELTDAAVERVLLRSGLSYSAAQQAAPGIRVSIEA